jgi:murein tripeptide amidase MpaA
MYHNVDEIETAISNLASAHPGLAERIDLPEGSADLHRTVGCLCMGTLGADAADAALFIFGQHAREWVPPEVALAFAADMLHAYTHGEGLTYGGMSYSAAQIRQVLDTINVFVVPCVNPDGRIFTMSSDDSGIRGWRRNRNTAHHATCHGVDLNRNYDFAFDLDRYFSASSDVHGFTSENPCNTDQVYQGPEPFSEPESRNIRWLFDVFPRIRWFIDIHGFRSEVYYPFGDDQNQSADAAMNWRNPAYDHQRGVEADTYREYIAPGDLSTHQLLAARLREGIMPVRGRSYLVTQSFTLYPTAGVSSDYAWSRHLTDWTKPRVEAFAIEHNAIGFGLAGFQPPLPEKDEIVSELTSGLINFCLSASCGVPSLAGDLRTDEVIFNHVPEGRTASRPVILQVTGCEAATFRIATLPSRTSGSTRISFGVAVGTRSVAHITPPATRDLFLWLTCSGGLDGDSAVGTVRVECPETGQTFDVTLRADFVRAPRARAVLVLDRSGSMGFDGGDGRTRLQVLFDAAPAFVDLAPPMTRIGVVRFATDDSPGEPMTTLGAEGTDAGRDAIRGAIAGHTLATGDASYTSIGDGVHAGNALITPEPGLDPKALVVLTDGHENRARWLSEVAGLINDRVFAIGLGTPEQIEPIALDTLTNGTGGYLLMTGTLDPDDPYRLEKYYLQILTGITNDQVVLDPDGWLGWGASQSIPFRLNEADQSVDAIVLFPAPGLLRVRLRTPSGQVLGETHPSLKWTLGNHVGFYRYTLPVPGPSSFEGPGRWELLLDWRRKPNPDVVLRQAAAGIGQHGLRYSVLVHARSELEMTATLAQTSRVPGAQVTVRARLSQYQEIPIEGARVRARVRFPDGSASTLWLAAQGEGVYQGTFTASLSGVYRVRITAEGRSLRGAPFTREALRTAAVWAGGDRPPPNATDEDWCKKLGCLIDSGVLNPEVLKQFGIDVGRLGKCCPPDEPEGGGRLILRPNQTPRRPQARARKRTRRRK